MYNVNITKNGALKEKKMKVSVLTPTYNRATQLYKLYESLKMNLKNEVR